MDPFALQSDGGQALRVYVYSYFFSPNCSEFEHRTTATETRESRGEAAHRSVQALQYLLITNVGDPDP